MSHPPLPASEVVPQIISEIVEAEAEIAAIGAILVMKDGSVKTKLAYTEGTRLPLLGGVDLFHDDLRIHIRNHSQSGPNDFEGHA